MHLARLNQAVSRAEPLLEALRENCSLPFLLLESAYILLLMASSLPSAFVVTSPSLALSFLPAPTPI